MAQASSLISRITKAFNRHDNADILAVAMDNSTTSLSYTGILPAWGPGSVAEIDSELMLV